MPNLRTLVLFASLVSISTAYAGDVQTEQYVQKFKDGLKADPRCEKYKQRYEATLAVGTMAQGVFMNALMKEYEAAKAEKCVKPTPVNGLSD